MYVFPRWTNSIKLVAGVALAFAPVYAIALIWIGASPKAYVDGYRPDQPVPYSHRLHVGELGMDCRYCHNTVDQASFAAIPPTTTCMNCHQTVRTDSPKLEPVRESYASGLPVEWVKVHDLPDYAYFDHSAHVTRGISCVSCHGRVDKMDIVEVVQPLSMAWCLECHRDPVPNIRPKELVTRLDFNTDEEWTSLREKIKDMNLDSLRGYNFDNTRNWRQFSQGLKEHYNINPPVDCSSCHR